MAQTNFDRRRINGPDESFQPVFDSGEEEENRWKLGNPRQGRAAREIRPICMLSIFEAVFISYSPTLVYCI